MEYLDNHQMMKSKVHPETMEELRLPPLQFQKVEDKKESIICLYGNLNQGEVAKGKTTIVKRNKSREPSLIDGDGGV